MCSWVSHIRRDNALGLTPRITVVVRETSPAYGNRVQEFSDSGVSWWFDATTPMHSKCRASATFVITRNSICGAAQLVI